MEIQTEIEMMKDRIFAIEGEISALEEKIVVASNDIQMEKDKLASLTESAAVENCKARIKSLNDDKNFVRSLLVEKTKLLTGKTKLLKEMTKVMLKRMPKKEQPEHILGDPMKTEGSQSTND